MLTVKLKRRHNIMDELIDYEIDYQIRRALNNLGIERTLEVIECLNPAKLRLIMRNKFYKIVKM